MGMGGTSHIGSTVALSNGGKPLPFLSPGEDSKGHIDVQTNIASRYPWLLGPNGNPTIFNSEAKARVSFGLFKGSDHIVFRREFY
jgi:MSHA biogenesis protein MshQ